jgi:predicted double-glycine peptidase
MSISLAGPTVIQGAGGSFSVPVVSLKEKRWTHVVRQQYDFSCGSAAVATLLTYHYETPIDEATVFKEMFARGDQAKIQAEGFSMLDIKQFLDRRGLKSDGFRMSLDKLAEIGVPAIVLINVGGYRHFVVIKGIEAKRILVADPAFGTTIWPRDRFEAAWGGGIILAAREGIEVAQVHFGDIPDWQIRPKAPISQGVDRSGLATFTLTMPGRHEFGR